MDVGNLIEMLQKMPAALNVRACTLGRDAERIVLTTIDSAILQEQELGPWLLKIEIVIQRPD